jgi:hypothetical protein
MRAVAGADAVVFSFGIPSEPVMFYSHVLTHAVWRELSSATLQSMLRGTEADIYFFVRQGQKDLLWQVLGTAGRPASLFCQNEDYSVIFLPRRPRTQSGDSS